MQEKMSENSYDFAGGAEDNKESVVKSRPWSRRQDAPHSHFGKKANYWFLAFLQGLTTLGP